jgi:serine/threonine-protein kinase
MLLGDAARTRRFSWAACAFAAVCLVFVPFFDGDPTLELLLAVGVAGCGGTFLWLALRLRDPTRYTMPVITTAAVAVVAAVLLGVVYFGPFSPVPVLLPVGIYFFSLSGSRRATMAIWTACAGGYGVIAGLVALGAVEDRGVFQPTGMPGSNRFLAIALVEATLLLTLLVARATRSATEQAIREFDRAVRGIARREALLAEARQELDQALKAGGVGRFTDQVMGSFRLGVVIGRGGMGEVYDATHVESGAPAAVKMLHAHVLGDADTVRRFLREARIGASLRVPNVVEVFEIGDVERSLPYIAMELLEGETLADRLRKDSRLPLHDVVDLARQVGRALDAARAAGVVHRDLKPRNLFFVRAPEGEAGPSGPPEGVWKVLDFGVSKLVDYDATQHPGRILGTPGYMAPEQAVGGVVTHKTDLFALAIVCYRALTGRPAFTGEGMVETVYQVVHCMPPRPSETARLHPDVDLALAVGLAKEPAYRFERGEDLANALATAGRGRLDAGLRLRAQRILAGHPWGSDQMTPRGVPLPKARR